MDRRFNFFDRGFVMLNELFLISETILPISGDDSNRATFENTVLIHITYNISYVQGFSCGFKIIAFKRDQTDRTIDR